MRQTMRAAAASVATLMIAGFAVVVGLAAPVSAATTSFTVDDIEYTYDNEAALGSRTATITDYAGGAGPVTIPQNVDLPILAGGDASYLVTAIGDNAFEFGDVTAVSIPDSVTTIGAFAFVDNEISSLTLGNSVVSIGANAFIQNKLTSVTIPDSVTVIDDYAFTNNEISSLTLGNSVVSIGVRAFATNDLTSVTIPDSVTTIAHTAFTENSLTSLTIGSSVQTIGLGAFVNNPALATVTFEGDAPTVTAAGPSGSFGEATGKILEFYSGAAGFTTPTWQGYNTFEINPNVAPVITTPASLPPASEGTAYSQQIEATGTPAPSFTVTSGTLPAGLMLGTDGLLSGTPTAAGTASFTITATNSEGSDSRAFTLDVEAPVITTEAQLVAAITGSSGGDEIELAPGVTITLTDDLPIITHNITLLGNGATIDGVGQYRTLAVEEASVAIEALTVENSGSHGIEASNSSLTIRDARVTGSGESGLRLLNTDAGTYELTISDSAFLNNGDNGISAETAPAVAPATTRVSIINTVASSNGHNENFLNGSNGVLLISGASTDNVLSGLVTAENFDSGIEVRAGLRFGAPGTNEGDVAIVDTYSHSNGTLGLYASTSRNGSVTVERSTFSNNDQRGIMVYLDTGQSHFSNVTASHNGTSSLPSANFIASSIWGGAFSMTHSTVTGNHSSDWAFQIGIGVTATVHHSIIGGNSTPLGDLSLLTPATVDHSLISSGDAYAEDAVEAGTGNLPLAMIPGLGPLGNNGGVTPTHLPDTSSPVINAGNPAFSGPPTVDQRGMNRIVDVVDIGSVEVQGPPPPETAPEITTSASLPKATEGMAYHHQILATGFPTPTFAVTDGNLPPGLTLSASGLLSGTPSTQGSSTFTITAMNSVGADARSFTLETVPVPSTDENDSSGDHGELVPTGAEPTWLAGTIMLLLLAGGLILAVRVPKRASTRQ